MSREVSEHRPDTGATRDLLVKVGIAVMRERPWERVSAKSIADAAGLDPALVTYHFGGRSGLVAAVATETANALQSRMAINYAELPDVESALRSAVIDPIGVIASEPFLIQLWVRELLLNGDDRTDVVLHDLAVPYLSQIHEAIENARRRGIEVDDGDGTLAYVLTATAQLWWFLAAWMRRSSHTPLDLMHPGEFARRVTEFILHGTVSPGKGNGVEPADLPPPRPGTAPHRDDIVAAALALMRTNHRSEVTRASVAAVNGFDLAAVAEEFPTDTDLALEVARAAVGLLATPPTRGRGRPPVRNPELERNLVRSAIELIDLRGVAVPARAVATRAGCDPALVTYYFNGKTGLFRAAAVEVLSGWVATFVEASEGVADPTDAVRAGLEPLVREIAERPNMSRFLLDEILVSGSIESDQQMAAVLAPYAERIQAAVAREQASGRARDDDPTMLFVGLGVMPLFLAAMMPIMHRAFRGPIETPSAAAIARGVVRLVFDGVLADPHF